MDNERARQAHFNGALLAADGTPRLPHIAYDDDGYPYDDGAPLGQNKKQIDQLFYAFPALQKLVRERFPGALAASDMFVYRRRGDVRGRAPDIFVAFGADDYEERKSYKLFEGDPVPSFVLEVLSDSSTDEDPGPKREEYAAWGVEEYWMFDPFEKRIPGRISAERLRDGAYEPIAPLPRTAVYPSAVLGVEMRAEGGQLRIRDATTGRDLRGYGEEFDARQAAEERADAAEERADAAAERADAAKERAAKAEQRLAEAKQRADDEAAARKALEVELAELRRAQRGPPA